MDAHLHPHDEHGGGLRVRSARRERHPRPPRRSRRSATTAATTSASTGCGRSASSIRAAPGRSDSPRRSATTATSSTSRTASQPSSGRLAGLDREFASMGQPHPWELGGIDALHAHGCRQRWRSHARSGDAAQPLLAGLHAVDRRSPDAAIAAFSSRLDRQTGGSGSRGRRPLGADVPSRHTPDRARPCRFRPSREERFPDLGGTRYPIVDESTNENMTRLRLAPTRSPGRLVSRPPQIGPYSSATSS